MQQKAAVRKPSLLFPLKQSREHVLPADSSEKAWALNKKCLDMEEMLAPLLCHEFGNLHRAEIGNCSGSAWLVCKAVFERGYEQ